MISMRKYTGLALLAGFGTATLALAACGSIVLVGGPDETSDATTGAGGSLASSTAVTVAPSSSTVGQGGAGGDSSMGGACGTVSHETTLSKKPADIIFVIDNSGSMGEEINSVEANINVNFAQIIAASAVDYRVIMLSEHGTDYYDVCVAPPLSGTTNCNQPPVSVPNQFYHYSVDVQSHDSLCKVLNTIHGPNGGGEADAFDFAPDGWSTWLRQEAVKIFVEITDDRANCNWGNYSFNDQDQVTQGQQVAVEWDQALRISSLEHFGNTEDRNYLFYSIVGLSPQSNGQPYEKYDPIQLAVCSSGVASGTAYQWLSVGTGAVRYPVCNYQSYDAVFQHIAAGVIEVTAVPCEWDMPEPEPGETYDYETLDVAYRVGGMGTPQSFNRVDNASQCVAGAFYIEPDHHVVLCPQTCDTVRADDDAELDANVWCE